MLPLRARGRGAVYYPTRLQGIYQAAQNMASTHLCKSCQAISPVLKQELCRLRERRDNASGGKQYWAKGAQVVGVVENEDGSGLSFRPSANDSATNQTPNDKAAAGSEPEIGAKPSPDS